MADYIYPPLIDSKLPPIEYLDGYYYFQIPFDFTGFTTENNLYSITIKISEAASNYVIFNGIEVPVYTTDNKYNYIDLSNRIVYARTNEISLYYGQFYKIQIAFKLNKDDINPGYFSSYGIAKCLNSADFNIGLLEFEDSSADDNSNLVKIFNLTEVTGFFSSKDLSETPVKYEFNIYNDNVLVESSGVLVHNNSKANEITSEARVSYDTFKITSELTEYKEYRIEYIVYTVNGLVKISNNNTFSNVRLFPLKFASDIGAEVDVDNACIKVYISPNLLLGKYLTTNISMKGKYKLFRSSDKTNFSTWEHILNFQLPNLKFLNGAIKGEEFPENAPQGTVGFVDETEYPKNYKFNDTNTKFAYMIYVDYLIEQGVKYKYAISVIFNEGEIGEQQSPKVIIENPVQADYETAFLYDKDYQLIIKYNPKISNLKTTKLEQKIDTLGGIYPYFTRNYNTNYKEFPISGLISILMDDQQLFNKGLQLYDSALIDAQNINKNDSLTTYKNEKYRISTYDISDKNKMQDYKNTDLVRENFKIERDFKLKVLDWLNNGELKVFKSPGEGNYIVRLMNVSLTPTDSLGRMLHTFSCTAYEAAPYNLKSLMDNNLFNLNSYVFGGIQKETVYYSIVEDPQTLQKTFIFDLRDYSKITKIEFFNFPIGSQIIGLQGNDDDYSVWDPPLYAYDFSKFTWLDNLNSLFEIQVVSPTNSLDDAYIIIYTEEFAEKKFDKISDLKYDKVIIKQYIGEKDYNIEANYEGKIFTENIFNPLTDYKMSSTYIQKIKAYPRPIAQMPELNLNNLDDLIGKILDNRIFPNPLYLYANDGYYYTQDIYGMLHKYNENDALSAGVPTIYFSDDKEPVTPIANELKYENYDNVSELYIPWTYYCELTYPIYQILYTGEQKWRELSDNTIHCSSFINNEESFVKFNTYNWLYLPNTIIDQATIDFKTKMNGKYITDRNFVINVIKQNEDSTTEGA